MVHTIKIYITLIFFFFCYNCIHGKPTKEQRDKINSTQIKQNYRFEKLPDDGSYTIEMRNISGNVTIIGKEASGGLIILERIFFGLKNEQEILQAHKLESASVKHILEDSLIQISGTKDNHSGQEITKNLYFELPKHVNIDFKIEGGDYTINDIRGTSVLETLGGDISIKNSSGDIDLKTEGGDIKITNLEGELRSHSSGGKISIRNSNGELNLSTIGGDIILEDSKGILDIQSSGGSINLININADKMTCRTSGGTINGENISGKSILKSFGNNIKLLDISGDFDIYTSGGSIEINQLRGKTKCEAEAGNITLNNAAGSIESFTSAGNILLNLVYDSSLKNNSIYLETHSGNLTANLPKDLSANIETIIHQTTSVKKLNSEIALDIKIENNKIIGKRIISGGAIPINIIAHQGEININEN